MLQMARIVRQVVSKIDVNEACRVMLRGVVLRGVMLRGAVVALASLPLHVEVVAIRELPEPS